MGVSHRHACGYHCRVATTPYFCIVGKNAQELDTIVAGRKPYLKSAHPSPFSAYRGFFGLKPFSHINRYLEENGETPIDWSK